MANTETFRLKTECDKMKKIDKATAVASTDALFNQHIAGSFAPLAGAATGALLAPLRHMLLTT